MIMIKWKHIMKEQPAHGEEIIQTELRLDGGYRIGISEYYQAVPFDEFLSGSRDMGFDPPDFWWISAKDFPFPEKLLT